MEVAMPRFFPLVVCLALLATAGSGYYVMTVLTPVRVIAQSADDVCVASTPSGRLRGVQQGAACAYLGVPYATPPVGNLRWKPPQPRAPWAPSVLDAVSPPPACAQVTLPPGAPVGALAGNEDCLMLNIWAPAQPRRARMPVIVWLHPGSFYAASANLAAANGARFAQEENVIIVAPNYRLGPFGFLAHGALTVEDPAYRSSGNYGLLDQRAALVWVRDHIAAFGGDPRNVTIAGTSAGGHSVSLHLLSPGSAGLFHRAIMQSGSAASRWLDAAEAEAQGDQFARALGCPDVRSAVACLRSKTRDEVLRALPIDLQKFVEAGQWTPVVDGLEIPDQPRELYRRGQFNRVPLIIGVQRDEGWVFVDRSFPGGLSASDYASAVIGEFGFDGLAILERYPAAQYPTPKDALARLTGDAEYVCEARLVAFLVEKTGTPVYLYSFEHSVATLSEGRSIHGIETNFLFGNNFGAPSNHVLNAADQALFSAMGEYWARFAATGNPNAGSDTQWPGFTRSSAQYLVLDTSSGPSSHLREEYCNFWEHYYFRSLLGTVPASRP
jgi:para-nitrobenzyl esterase